MRDWLRASLLALDHARLGAAAGRGVIRRKQEPAAAKKEAAN
jgi:hypothetical protein